MTTTVDIASTPQPRRPWVAALMSLALPGWGQLYNGQADRAIWMFLGFALLLLPATAMLALAVPPAGMALALLLGALGGLVYWLAAAADAWRGARREPAYRVRPWQTGGLYTLVFVTCALVVLPALTVWMRANLAQPFYIPSASMAPALLPGDMVFADMHYNCHGCRPVQRGDVAIFTNPNDRTQYHVKRIVALPGDRVLVQGDEVVVNGAPAAASLTVPPGHVWLLGDNRASSVDSRQFGPVPLPDVVGRVRQIWFSRGDGAVRWDRIGALVR
jgi:signal peptidase I